ncbi:MAG: hypothetical protein Roseis2KO_56560 [Roseivirga sp.]
MLTACGGIQSKYPLDKQYWNPDDYDEVLRLVRFDTPGDERFPEFENQETSPIIRKLVDHQNFLVILTDETLGLSYRNNISDDFFDHYKTMANTYRVTNEKDEFVYDDELIEIQKFGLDLQLHYFKLGNDRISKEADDPEAYNIKSLLSSNLRTVFSNYNNYLDLINNEKAFTSASLEAYAAGIDKWFPKLFESFPNGDFEITEKKAKLMLKKSESPVVKSSLEQLLSSIEDLKTTD